MPRIALAFLTALVLAAAGCGGDDSDEGGGGNGGGGGATQQASDPAKLFADNCGSCHTLGAAGTEGTVGPNLDDAKPDAEAVKTAIAEGPSVMPENIVEGADADAVATYVADNAGK